MVFSELYNFIKLLNILKLIVLNLNDKKEWTIKYLKYKIFIFKVR